MIDFFLKSSFSVRTGLVADPEAKHVRGMRQSVWLYLFLLAAVNPGTAERLIDPRDVARSMGLSEGTVRSWLGQLRKKGYVACRRDGPAIWVRILRWKADRADKKGFPSRPNGDQLDLDRSLTIQHLARALGESSGSPELANLVATYSQDRIRAALEEVLAVPDERIKKSRLSFLIYLLKKSN